MEKLYDEYFEWLLGLLGVDELENCKYLKTLAHLYTKEFTWTIPTDKNRAVDGIALRRIFLDEFRNIPEENFIDAPCTLLEMMVALAHRCEENIMWNPDIGDRTGDWFWMMFSNLGLDSKDDEHYDHDEVDYILNRLLDRTYAKNGLGGLFYIPNTTRDLRKAEIWYQLSWYLVEVQKH